ncbi:MAG: AI-2E family transporter [Patescibacteria group bacterium]
MVLPRPDNVTINISGASFLKVLVFIVLFYAIYILRDLVLVVLVSVVIASAIEPITRWLSRFRLPRVLAVVLIYLAAFLVVGSLVPFFILPLVQDLVELSATLPARLNSIELFQSNEYLMPLTGIINFHDFLDGLQTNFSGLTGGLLRVAGVAGSFFGGLASFVLVLVISFYLAVQQGGIESFLRLITPIRWEKYSLDLWRRTQAKIGLWMQGQLLLGVLVGVIVFLGLTIFGVRYSLVLAIIAAIFELIPVFGPILSAIPAIVIALDDGPTLGLMVLGLYIVIQQFENNLLYPLVVKKMVGVPSLVIILALLVGAKLAGFLGLILAVPAATLAMEILSDLELRKKGLVETA